MMKRTLYLTVICLLFANTACMQKALPPESLSTPEFMSVKCDVKESGNDRSAILTAVLNSSNGVEASGFMFGSDETEMRFIETPIEDCTFSTELPALTPGDYVYYATVSNGRNTVRTNMFNFTIEQRNSSTIITPPGSDDDNDTKPDDGNGSMDDDITTPPDSGDDGKPLPPPEGSELPISDSNFLEYLLAQFDTDNNGIITRSEAESVTAIEVNTDKIKTLDGISYFTNIGRLVCKGGTSHGGLTGLLLGNNDKRQTTDSGLQLQQHQKTCDTAVHQGIELPLQQSGRGVFLPVPISQKAGHLRKLCFCIGYFQTLGTRRTYLRNEQLHHA